jgi:translation initiation factor 2B subunit (eIF-2B alpha/beta/delta family)
MFLGEPENLRRVAVQIANARPSVVAIRNVGVAAFVTAREARVGDRMAAATRSASRLARLLEATPMSLGRRAQSLMADRVVTAGYSLGVLAALIGAKERLKLVKVIDGAEGSAEVVEQLTREGISVDLIPEAQADSALGSSEVTLLGCNALLADGSAVSPSAAARLARVALTRRVPVQMLADTLKLAPWLPRGASDDKSWELIPSTLIDHVVTEDGIRRPNQLLAAARDLSPRWGAFEAASPGAQSGTRT